MVPRTHPVPFAARFVLEQEIGRGGVGVVYRARDRITSSLVALKIISVHGFDSIEDQRFAREGRLLSELDHPQIVKVVAWGVADEGTPYIAMEWLSGEDLAARSKRQPLALRESLFAMRDVAWALAYAHQRGVVHRDVKPSNIFILAPPEATSSLDATVSIKLVDFGVASEQDIRVTRTGLIMGTPAYMAPEQARGDGPPDGRSDVYSIGATLYELISGRPPHLGPTAMATLARVVTSVPVRLSALVHEIPKALDDLVMQMLAVDPSARPPDAGEVASRLSALLAGPGILQTGRASLRAEPAPALTLQGSRLLTSLVVAGVEAESRPTLHRLCESRGADVAPLGHDALVAHFGARRVLGDEAFRALELARALSTGRRRIGVASGRMHGDLSRPVGEVIDRAVSLAHTAAPGQILADPTTSELGRGRFQFQVRADGSAVVGESLSSGKSDGPGGGAPLLGREPEIAQIVSSYTRCVEDRTPLLLSLSGPPGIGKTRLAREAISRLGSLGQPPRTVLVRSESFGRAHPLRLAADVLRAVAGLSKGCSRDMAQAALMALLSPNGLAGASGGEPPHDLLASLIANESLPESFDTRGARDALWLSMTQFVLRVIAQEPYLLVLEDLQWADPESVGFIDHLLGRAEQARLMVFVLVRPEFFREGNSGEKGPRFAGRDHVRLELRPISRSAARGIAKSILGTAVSDSVLDRIAQQSAGSPLFAEELARLTATGRDPRKAPTIEAAIQASLDCLEDACRDALCRLAIFGLSGWDKGALALGVKESDVLLRQLVCSELLVEQADSRFEGAREFAFKHALVRDVAYRGLDEATKVDLHACAGEWLAEAGEDSATVAEHLERGKRLPEAAVHWERAARRALDAHALRDAVRMAEAALAHARDAASTFARALLLDTAWSRLDPRASDRQSAIVAMNESAYDEPTRLRAEGARARFDDARGIGSEIVERLARVRARAEALDLPDEEARCAATLAARHAFAGELEQAEAAASHLLSLAERRAMIGAAVDGYQTLAIVHQTRGELGRALDARKRAVDAARTAGLLDREATLTANLGFALTTIGARAEALATTQQGLHIARSIGSVGAERHARMILLCWSATFGAEGALDAELSDLRALADEVAEGLWLTTDRASLGVVFYRGCELLRQADGDALERSRHLLRASANAYRSTANRDVLPVALGAWAEAERRCGAPEIAIELSNEAALLFERGAPSLLNESAVYLTLHDAALELGNQGAARNAIERAIPLLLRRYRGLSGTPYAPLFLTEVQSNARLLERCREYRVPLAIDDDDDSAVRS